MERVVYRVKDSTGKYWTGAEPVCVSSWTSDRTRAVSYESYTNACAIVGSRFSACCLPPRIVRVKIKHRPSVDELVCAMNGWVYIGDQAVCKDLHGAGHIAACIRSALQKYYPSKSTT